jgi:uncharacterized protein YndB with AHSA1/START domain
MSVKIDESGRRWVAVEVEVPGTPEQVWHAIATGEGVSSWFVPTKIGEEDPQGNPTKVVSTFGPGMDAVADIEEWEPPHRFRASGAMGPPGSPPIATEWIVEARDGGTCMVRVVHSLFAESDDWDGQLEGTESGWPAFFRTLRLYLTHFPGQAGVPIQTMVPAPAGTEAAWSAMVGPLNLADAEVGDRFEAEAGVPSIAGVVEEVGTGEGPGDRRIFVRLERPVPGIGHLFTLKMGPQVMAFTQIYLFGEGAPEAAAELEPAWGEWLAGAAGGGGE